jgi:plasmid stabilization system protein ParE
MQVILRPAAAADIEDAISWYERQRRDLGGEFLEAVNAALKVIAQKPRLAPLAQRQTHRFLLRRFPYAIYYRIEGDLVLVVACMHGRRSPRRWRSRR